MCGTERDRLSDESRSEEENRDISRAFWVITGTSHGGGWFVLFIC